MAKRQLSTKDAHPFDDPECPYNKATPEGVREGEPFSNDPRGPLYGGTPEESAISPAPLTGWDRAIYDAEQGMARAKQRLALLKAARALFIEKRDAGEPWPGEDMAT